MDRESGVIESAIGERDVERDARRRAIAAMNRCGRLLARSLGKLHEIFARELAMRRQERPEVTVQ